MQAGADGIAILPVVVVMRAFPARPSSVPDIREFVRQHLANTHLSGEDIRALCHRVADVLLEAAGTGGTIQVSLRIFDTYAEVDVLQTNEVEPTANTGASGSTVAVGASPRPNCGVDRPERAPAAAAGRGPVTAANANGATRPAPDGASFAKWLADALRREGMTMEAAARKLRVSVKTVSRWVGGVTEPRLRDLSRIREIFGDVPFP